MRSNKELHANSRTMFVTTSGFAPTINFWMLLYERFACYLDRLYIIVSTPINREAWSLFKESIPESKNIRVIENCGAYPYNLQSVINRWDGGGSYIVCHDDTLIFNPKLVDTYFSMAEQGYILTPLQLTYSPIDKVREYIKEKYNVERFRTPSGQEEYSFILNFLIGNNFEILKDIGAYKIENTDYSGDFGFKVLFEILERKLPVIALNHSSVGSDIWGKNPVEDLKANILRDGWVHIETLAYETQRLFDEILPESEYKEKATKAGLEARLGFLQFATSLYYSFGHSGFITNRINNIIEIYELNLSNVNNYMNLFKEIYENYN